MDDYQGMFNKFGQLKVTKGKNPYYPSDKYLRHVYGKGKVPVKHLIEKKLMKEALEENIQQVKRKSAAKKIQSTLMPYNDVFGRKKYPSRFSIKIGNRLYDSRWLKQWLKNHNSLPRPWNKVELSSQNRERVQMYNRRKLYRHGKRAYDLNSPEYHALAPVEKRRRIQRALEIFGSR